MPPGVGALTEADGRCLMMLLDMGRYLVNEITQEHKFSSLTDVSILRQSRMDIVMDLTGKMWSYWHSAPAGPGVYEMMLDWCKQQAPSAKSIRKREIGIAEGLALTISDTDSQGGGFTRLISGGPGVNRDKVIPYCKRLFHDP